MKVWLQLTALVSDLLKGTKYMNDLLHKHVSSLLHECLIMGENGTTPATEIYGKPA